MLGRLTRIILAAGVSTLVAMPSLVPALGESGQSHGQGFPQNSASEWRGTKPDPHVGKRHSSFTYGDEGEGEDYIKFRAGSADVSAKGQASNDDPDEPVRVGGKVTSADQIVVTVAGNSEEWACAKVANNISWHWDWNCTNGGTFQYLNYAIGTDVLGAEHPRKLYLKIGGQSSSGSVEEASHELESSLEGSVNVGKDTGGSVKGKVRGKDAGKRVATSDQNGQAAGQDKRSDADPTVWGVKGWARCPENFLWDYSSVSKAELVVLAGDQNTRAESYLDQWDILNEVEGFGVKFGLDPNPPGPPDPTTPMTPYGALSLVLPEGSTPVTTVAENSSEATACLWGSRGLDAELASRGGELLIELTRPAPRDFVWTLSASPASAVGLPATLTVRAGSTSAAVGFKGLQSGTFDVAMQLLDSQGVPTPASLLISAANLASGAIPSPDMRVSLQGAWAGGAVTADDEEAGIGIRGTTPGRLRIERTSFDDLMSESSTVNITTTDTAGILGPVASNVTIPAGERLVDVPIELTNAEGSAVVTVWYGSSTFDVPIKSVSQEIVPALTTFVVPMGSETGIPIHLRATSLATEVVTASSNATSVLDIASSSASMVFRPLTMSRILKVIPVSPGNATITLQRGSESVVVSVTVVAQEVTVSRTLVTLQNLQGSAEGFVGLLAPPDATFASAAVPSSLEGAMTIQGIGTGLLSLWFADGISRPSVASIPIVLSGAPTNEFQLQIGDDLHERKLEYAVTVP